MLQWLLGNEQRKVAFRDTLFGDLSVPDWVPETAAEAAEEPWATFTLARQATVQGEGRKACEALHRIRQMKGLDPRHYLQSWHFTRLIGCSCGESALATPIHGVIVEVSTKPGCDILAVYDDGSTRYQHASGQLVVCLQPTPEIREQGARLIAAAAPLLDRITPWRGKHPKVPDVGQARISVLTPAGLHFGQGTHAELLASPLAQPIMEQAAELVKIIAADLAVRS